ncbi:unnamed protein product [Prunus armeniaca]
MGVYYNISKFQPNWINLEPSARQRLNHVHRNVMLAAIKFNLSTSLEPYAKYGQPHIGVKSAQELRRMNKIGKYGKLEQLGAAKRGVLHHPRGRTKLHSINR